MFDKLQIDESSLNIDILSGSGEKKKFGKIKDTGAYKVTVKKAYGEYSASGAMAIVLQLEADNGLSLNSKEYVCAGDAKANKVMFTFAKYVNANDILGFGKKPPRTETKQVMIFDYKSRQEVPQEKEVLVDWLGKSFTIVGFKLWEDKYGEESVSVGKFEISNIVSNDDTDNINKFLEKYPEDFVKDKRVNSKETPNPDEQEAERLAKKEYEAKQREKANAINVEEDTANCPF